MGTLKRISAFIGLMMVASIGAGQMVAWQQSAPSSKDAKIYRDGSSNLYLASQGEDNGNTVITVKKVNPHGIQLWIQNEVVPTPGQSEFYRFSGLKENGGHVSVGFQRITDQGMLPVDDGQLRMLNAADGTSAGSWSLDEQTYGEVKSFDMRAGTMVASTSSMNDLRLHRYNLDQGAWQFGSSVTLDWDVVAMTRVVLDNNGTAYIGYAWEMMGSWIDPLLFKWTAGGQANWHFMWNQNYQDTIRPRLLGLDETSGGVYVVSEATHAQSMENHILTGYMSEQGVLTQPVPVIADQGNVSALELLSIPGDGFLLRSHDGTATAISKISPNLTRAFSASLGTTLPAARGMAFDPHGNAVVLSNDTVLENLVFSRFDKTSGTVISESRFPAANSFVSTGLFMDAAGSSYVSGSDTNESYFTRVEHGQLTFASPTSASGNVVEATITIPSAAVSNQTWTVRSSNAGILSVPTTVEIAAGQTSVNFNMTVQNPSAHSRVTVNATSNGYIMQKSFVVVAPVLQSVGVNQQTITGGADLTGTVTLTHAAGVGGYTVGLSSNKPGVASVPADVLVAQGDTSANFTITTYGVSANQGVVITATLGSVSKTKFIAVMAPLVSQISAAEGSVVGGQVVSLTVTLNAAAPAGGLVVQLSSDTPSSFVLISSVRVPAGETSVTFNVNTKMVQQATPITVSARRAGVTQTTVVTLTP